MPQANSQSARTRGIRKTRDGVVVSDKPDKSAVVRVERTIRHPLYKKVVKRSKKYLVHDEDNRCKRGDVVRIMECRPLSRHKRWRLVDVLSRPDAPLATGGSETAEG